METLLFLGSVIAYGEIKILQEFLNKRKIRKDRIKRHLNKIRRMK